MQALTTLLPAVPLALWWLVVALAVLAGLAGTVLPVLPGTLLILAGLLLGAWIDGFQAVGPWPMTAIAVLAVLALAIDFVAGVLGAQRVGASRWALVGGAVGTVAGLFMGLVGVLFMPFVGAMLGEWFALRRRRPGAAATGQRATAEQALKVGTATWLGMLVGAAAKIALSFVMIGIFIAALLWN